MAAAKSAPAPDIAARDLALAMLGAPAWKPLPGETLTARVAMIRRGGENSEYGVYPILVFAPVDGFPFPTDAAMNKVPYVAFHAFHSIVKKALGEIRPNPADAPILTIRYVGRRQFGETVEGKDGPVYVERPDKSDYEEYMVLEGDGTTMDLGTFSWDEEADK